MGFGIQTIAYPLGILDDSYSDTEAYWFAFGTEMADSTGYVQNFTCYGPTKYYAKGRQGYYLEVESRRDDDPFYSSGAPGTNSVPSNGLTEIAVPFPTLPSDRFIVWGGRWYFKGQAFGTALPVGNIIFNLYVNSIGENLVLETTPVASCKIDKSNFPDSVTPGNMPTYNFWVEFRFSKPFVYGGSPGEGIPGESGITLGMVLDKYTGSSTTDFTSGPVLLPGSYYIRGTDKQWITGSASAYPPLAGLFCMEFSRPAWWSAYITSGFDYIKNGVYPATFAVLQGHDIPGQNFCDLTSLDLAVTTRGLTDEWGTITTATNRIEKPSDVIRLLTMSYNPTTGQWVDGDFDWTKYSSLYSTLFTPTHPYYRAVSGATEGDALSYDIVKQIAQEMCCQLVQQSDDGKIALLPWGTELSSVKVFTDENCQISGWQSLGEESIVNSLVLAYARAVINYLQDAATAQQGFENFTQALKAEDSNNQAWIELAQTSASIFGKRETQTRTLNWVGDSTSANTYMRWILSNFDFPHRTFSLKTTLKDNTTLNVGDVIEVLSSKLPAYYGTSSEARAPYLSAPASYQVGEVNLLYSNYMNRAQRYRAQIIERRVDLTDTAADLSLTCRILRPYHKNDIT